MILVEFCERAFEGEFTASDLQVAGEIVGSHAVLNIRGQRGLPQLYALAHNPDNLFRTSASSGPINDLSLSSLEKKLIKIGVKW